MPKSLSDISELKLKRMYDLVFSDTDKKGGYRVRKGAGFAYYDNKDQLIKCHKVKSRLKAIAVPPSYEDVWYCPNDNGHIQAVGKDSTGKKQYFYHDTWAEAANALKFESMQDFAFMLPRMRHKLRKALKNRAADKQTVIATMVKILDNTGMRIGHPRSAGNKTYGLANLMDRHVEIDDDIVHFEYTGKSNIHLEKSIQDSRVIDVLENSLELDSRKVFSYVDGHGDTCAVSATDVNVFIKSVMGQVFSAKDFRTWRFTVLFLKEAMRQTIHKTIPNPTQTSILDQMSEETGNTIAVLRQSYIHPKVLKAFKDQKILNVAPHGPTRLRKYERLVLGILNRS